MNHFGKLLKETRKRAGKSQQALANEIGVHDSYISMMEKGKDRSPSRKVALGLADALGLRDKADRKRIEFLSAAGVISAEDFEGFALVKVKDDEKLGSGQPPQKTSAPSTVFHAPLFISSQEVLVHRLAVLEKKLKAAEKNLHEAHEELRELHMLTAEMFSQE
jgi:transcriptional regulator with XRE-family HTH domain